jgi:hypothetical protein
MRANHFDRSLSPSGLNLGVAGLHHSIVWQRNRER